MIYFLLLLIEWVIVEEPQKFDLQVKQKNLSTQFYDVDTLKNKYYLNLVGVKPVNENYYIWNNKYLKNNKMDDFLMIDGVKTKLSPDQIRMIKNLNIIEKVNFYILNEDDWFYIETIYNNWLAKGNILNRSSKKGLHYNFKSDSLNVNYGPLNSNKDCYRLIRKATEEEINNLFEKFPKYNPDRKILNWKDILTFSGWYCNCIGNPILIENADPFKISVILFPSEEEAVANWALSKLLFLRDSYNKNWIPDWNDLSQKKYVISYSIDSIVTGTYYVSYKILAFKYKKTMDDFIINNKDLILKAKTLLQC